MKTATLLVAVFSFAPPASFAQYDTFGASSGPMQSEAGAEFPTAPAVPVPQTQGDVTWLCGGVGQDEAAFMKSAAREYDLMLTFAGRDGSYLADVDVTIADARGRIMLETNCDGPIMLVDLPARGNYKVHAETAGYSLERTVHVNAPERKGRELSAAVMTWPAAVLRETTSTGSSATGDTPASGSGDREW